MGFEKFVIVQCLLLIGIGSRKRHIFHILQSLCLSLQEAGRFPVTIVLQFSLWMDEIISGLTGFLFKLQIFCCDYRRSVVTCAHIHVFKFENLCISGLLCLTVCLMQYRLSVMTNVSSDG